jgi:AhpD family alkylhydroperoxidase
VRCRPRHTSASRSRVAEINGCNYCLSAHTYLGKNLAKLDDAEITANRNGASNDPKADAAIRFAVKVVREHGHVSEDDLRALKSAGYDDAQVIEIVLHVAHNTWTNYINEVAKTDIDFRGHRPCSALTGPPLTCSAGSACRIASGCPAESVPLPCGLVITFLS